MQKESFIKYLIYLFLFCLPFTFLIGIYIVKDPFKVIYDYDDYSIDGKKNVVSYNSDFVSTKVYLKNREIYHYNAFIFGSSRTAAFNNSLWQSYCRNSMSFTYIANQESLFGIHAKVKLLDKLNDTIKYALFELDAEILKEVYDSRGHLFRKHPLLSGSSMQSFQATSMSSFFADFFFVKYLDYKLFKNPRNYMEGLLQFKEITLDPVHNSYTFDGAEKELEKDSLSYYRNRISLFYNRDTLQVHYNPPVIKEKQKEMLTGIEKILRSHHSEYKIIISPLYNQVKLNKEDLLFLQKLFGENNVFDCSGSNSYTNDIGNYYETMHFKPLVGEAILKNIYHSK